MFPTLYYGTATSGIMSAKVASMNNPALSTIRMVGSSKPDGGPDNGVDTGLPMEIAPTTLDLVVIGCPYISIGQQYYVDMGTNTTADNFYAVFDVQHTFDNGVFRTSLKMGTLSSFGRWRSTNSRLRSIVAVAADAINENK
tara:strand:- start:159 stop:581 length:423 start_codon:yes stop_codon:yes gene_type:complete